MSEDKCAYCGKIIRKGEDAFVCFDRWLVDEYYYNLPDKKCIYCSKQCFADDWSVQPIDLNDYE